MLIITLIAHFKYYIVVICILFCCVAYGIWRKISQLLEKLLWNKELNPGRCGPPQSFKQFFWPVSQMWNRYHFICQDPVQGSSSRAKPDSCHWLWTLLMTLHSCLYRIVSHISQDINIKWNSATDPSSDVKLRTSFTSILRVQMLLCPHSIVLCGLRCPSKWNPTLTCRLPGRPH